eukprot:gene12560-biopygen14028
MSAPPHALATAVRTPCRGTHCSRRTCGATGAAQETTIGESDDSGGVTIQAGGVGYPDGYSVNVKQRFGRGWVAQASEKESTLRRRGMCSSHQNPTRQHHFRTTKLPPGCPPMGEACLVPESGACGWVWARTGGRNHTSFASLAGRAGGSEVGGRADSRSSGRACVRAGGVSGVEGRWPRGHKTLRSRSPPPPARISARPQPPGSPMSERSE